MGVPMNRRGKEQWLPWNDVRALEALWLENCRLPDMSGDKTRTFTHTQVIF